MSPVSTEITYLNVRGQADSVKTLMAGQTYWQRFHYESVRGMLDTVGVSGGAIAFRTRKYAYSSTTLALDSIRLVKAGTTAGATGIARDLHLQPTTFTRRGGDQVNLAYSSTAQLGSTSSSAAYADTVTQMLNYDAAGRLSLQIKGDGTWGESYTYDNLGRLTSDSLVQAPGPPPPGCTGNPPPIIGDDGSNCLTSESWTTNGGAAFSYDSAGNRKDQSGAYGTGNRITSFGGCSYGTDVDGEDTSRVCGTQTVKFRWSAESQLDSVIVGGIPYVYHYDANGRVVRKDSSGTTKSYFLWQGDQLLAEIAAGGTSEIAEYSYYPGLDRPHAIVVGGTEYDSWSDALGNATTLTDSSGNVQRGYAYDAWGAQLLGDSTLLFNRADRSRFKGALWIGSEANLYYMRNRWYEPSSGRFLSEDPMGVAGGLNPYVYAASNPVAGNDPTGLDCAFLVGTENPLQNCVDGPPLEVGGYGGGIGINGPTGPVYDPLGLGDELDGSNILGLCTPEVNDFVSANSAYADQISQETGVSATNLLGLSGLESAWGGSHIASRYNNYFGLYAGSAFKGTIGVYTTFDGRHFGVYPEPGFLTSGLSFAQSYFGRRVSGVSDPTTFAGDLTKKLPAFNSSDPQYANKLQYRISQVAACQ